MNGRLARRPEGSPYTLGRILAVYAAIMAALFLSTFDQTIVVMALPRIVSDLGGVNDYSWVVTAYLLALTVTVPLYGKLLDIYGARRLFLVAISLFLLGSGLCAAAGNMTQLIVWRTLQGVGGGGLVPLAMSTIATMIPPRGRGRYYGLAGATFAAAAIGGLPLGGVIVDGPGWRWIFLLNLPIGAVALAVAAAAMPGPLARIRRTVDWAGALVIAGATAAFLLGLIWGGHEYGWASPEVLGAFAGTVVLGGVGWRIERNAVETILPFSLLRDRAVGVGVLSLWLLGMALVGTIVFVPLFVEGVVGDSATSSGILVMPFMLGAVGASIASGHWVAATGRYKANAVAGLIALATGLALIWRMDAATGGGAVARNVAITGVGIGLTMQTLVVAVQNAVPTVEIGSVTSLAHFARSVGGTVGVAAMSAIATRDLPPGLSLHTTVPTDFTPVLQSVLVHALRPAFLFAACCAVLALAVVAVALEETPLQRSLDATATPVG
ncbi:MAG TPA: MFS transporter [Gaiellaceae bacterium]|nr:MFS transporter [Gaiellaceae bacterium]